MGWALLCSWPGCTELVHTGLVAGRVSLWVVWRGRRLGPLAWWLPDGWRARGSSWISPRPCPRSVGWTPGRSPSPSFRRERAQQTTVRFLNQQKNWIWSQWLWFAASLSSFQSFTGCSECSLYRCSFLSHAKIRRRYLKAMTHKCVIRKPDQQVLSTVQRNPSGIFRLYLCWRVSETSMTALVKHHQGFCCRNFPSSSPLSEELHIPWAVRQYFSRVTRCI